MALQKIRGRDKTTPTKYSIYISILLDWLPVLGRRGYAVYSAYVLIATLGVEVGARKVAKHLGMGETSFRIYTELLDMLGLIKLHRGGPRQPSTADILDPPPITQETIPQIRSAILEDAVLGRSSVSRFREALFNRLENWSSLRAQIDFDLTTLAIPHIPNSNGNGKGSSPKPVPIANDDDNAGLIDRLEKIKFDNAAAWLADKDQALVSAWLDEMEASGLTERLSKPAGYLRKQVETGKPPAPRTEQDTSTDTTAGDMPDKDYFGSY